MSMTNNGAPVGTDQIRSLASTDSWATPSEYRDPQTGKTYKADTLQDLLDLLQQEGIALFDNDEIRRQGKTTAPKGGKGGQGPSGDDAAQWDRLLIQLNHYTDPEKAREIIIEALANPDVSMTRNLGNGRTATKAMKGRRAVLAHEVHHDDERGPHFMAQVHTVALGPDGHISQKWSFTREDHKAMVEQVNKALADNGLAPLVFRLRDETGTSVATRKAQLDAEGSEEYRQAAEKGELPELLDENAAEQAADALPVSARKETLRQAAQQAGAQAASLYAQAQALQKQNAMYRQALRALESEEQHLARIASLNTKLEEAATNAATAEAQHAATVAEQAQAVEAATAQVVEVSATLEATQAHAAQVSEQLTDTREKLAGVEADLAQATEAGEQLEQRLEQTQGKLAQVETVAEESKTLAAGLQKALDAERTARTNETKAYEQELAEVRGALTSEQKARGNLERQLEKSRADLADERTEHGATKRELKTEAKRADTAERAADKAQAELAAMREQLAAERSAREEAERAARDALGAKATAEAQLAARPSQADLQAALADKAKAEGQRDQLRERLEAVLAERKPAPGNGNGPQA